MPKKVKQGVVVSDKMDKTIVVKVASYNPHPKYKKIIETNKNYKAHDEANECGIGDTVRIVESNQFQVAKDGLLSQLLKKLDRICSVTSLLTQIMRCECRSSL